jgi:hypothetical protein
MADNICISLKANGERCTNEKRAGKGDGTRCSTHFRVLEKNGPNSYAIMQLNFARKREATLLRDEYETRRGNPDLTDEERFRIDDAYARRVAELHGNYNRRVDAMENAHRAEVRRTGIDPDEPARQRRIAARQEVIQARIANAQAHLADFADVRVIQEMVNAGGGGLARFVGDAQNVHTTAAVVQTKKIVAKIRAIPVPEGYRWNTTECSKTPFEIGLACSLTPKATWQMISQYAQDTAIYDIEPGIYGKVLDGVWQFTKTSPEKESLCKVIKQEMEDNVGMCAQGNLSRICNVLAGYMEGVGSQESITEILGRLLPPLMSIEDATERMDAARKILADNKLPREEWYEWLDALRD